MGFSAEQLRQRAAILDPAFIGVVGRFPTLWERQAILAVAWLESGFGLGWKGACASSHNWGANQTSGPDYCIATDHQQDGTAFPAHIAVYPDDVSAAAGLVKEIARRKGALEAAAAGDLAGFSAALYNSHYFTGICSPAGPSCDAKMIRNHASSLARFAGFIAAALGEPVIPLGNLPGDPGERAASLLGWALALGTATGILALTLRKR